MLNLGTMLEGFRRLLTAPAQGPGEVRQACLCGKLVNAATQTLIRHSKVVNYRECLCQSCRTEMLHFCRVVCLGCRTLQVLLPPQRAKTGFVFARDTHVHVQRCPTCCPTATAAPVLEHLNFCRERGIATNADADIVQEIERNSLRAVGEADKLRGELQTKFTAP